MSELPDVELEFCWSLLKALDWYSSFEYLINHYNLATNTSLMDMERNRGDCCT